MAAALYPQEKPFSLCRGEHCSPHSPNASPKSSPFPSQSRLLRKLAASSPLLVCSEEGKYGAEAKNGEQESIWIPDHVCEFPPL